MICVLVEKQRWSFAAGSWKRFCIRTRKSNPNCKYLVLQFLYSYILYTYMYTYVHMKREREREREATNTFNKTRRRLSRSPNLGVYPESPAHATGSPHSLTARSRLQKVQEDAYLIMTVGAMYLPCGGLPEEGPKTEYYTMVR